MADLMNIAILPGGGIDKEVRRMIRRAEVNPKTASFRAPSSDIVVSKLSRCELDEAPPQT